MENIKYYLVWRESLELVHDESALTNSLQAIYFDRESAIRKAKEIRWHFESKIQFSDKYKCFGGFGELGGVYDGVTIYVYECVKVENELKPINTVYKWVYDRK